MILMDLEFGMQKLNPALLHEELAAAAGEAFTGISAQGQRVRVHLKEDQVTSAIIDAVTAAVLAHDPLLDTEQQKKEKLLAVLLDSLRKPWADWTTDDKDALLYVLADKWIALPDSGGTVHPTPKS